ncbi:glutamate receptor ionotropic, kainate 2-like isoform X2 [Centruroides vittatus]|uniref:glutamate receptor ionotropic, kainate 2-like isoform X2 n=1 Tax=Centruroides vittatus TaxID=120091 RepID=UPI003510C498
MKHDHFFVKNFLNIFLLNSFFINVTASLPEVIKIGAVFEMSNDDKEMTFRHAVDRVNANNSILLHTRLSASVKKVTPEDILDARRKICELLEEGVAAVLTPTSLSLGSLVKHTFDTYNIPHLQTGWDYTNKNWLHSLNFHPDYTVVATAYRKLVERWNWKTFTILYEEENGLIRLHEVFKAFEVGTKITVFKHTPGKSYRKLLKEIEKYGDTNIILDVPTQDIVEVLKNANEFHLLTEYHNYLVTSLDMFQLDFTEVYNGVTNITGFRLVDPEHLEIKIEAIRDEAGNRWPWKRKNTETILIYDAVMMFAKIMNDNFLNQPFSTAYFSCEYPTTWYYGNQTTDYLKWNSFHGISGDITFNNKGKRTNITLDVVQIKKEGLRSIGNWTGSEILLIDDYTEVFAEVAEVLANKTLRVTTIIEKPYVIERDDETLTGNEKFEGYCIDLLNEIKKELKFNYIVIPVKHGRHGKEKRPGSGQWDGMIGELINRKADIAIADLTITTERQQVVNFSKPYMQLGIGILFKKPDITAPNLFSFMYPFSTEVWITMATAYLGVTIWMYILARITPHEWSNPHPCEPHPRELVNQFNHPNSLWFGIGSLMQQGSEFAPRAISTRSLAAIWWFFTLIMISTYTANLAAFLTAKRMKSPIESASDLASQTAISYGCLEGGSTWNFFNNTDHDVYRRMFRNMEENKPHAYSKSTQKGVDRVAKGNYAFIMETTSLRYARKQNCELTQIGEKFVEKSYGIAFPQGIQLYQKFSFSYLIKKFAL